MPGRAKRWWIAATAVVALGLVLGAAVFGVKLCIVLTAYKAKMLCSEVFVAGRSADQALADLDVNDLSALRAVHAVADPEARAANASFLFGAIQRRARFRDGGGCSVTFGDDNSRPALQSPEPTHAADALRTALIHRLDGVLDAAFSEPDPAHPRRTRAIVVVHDGQIVAERYAAGIGPDTPLLGWSMSKSVVNALVGILVGRGKLALDAAIPVPAWSGPDDPRRRITLSQLLRMSSGLRFDERPWNPLNDVTYMLFRTPDMARFAEDRALATEPGTRWEYANGTSLVIADAMRRVLGDDEYRRFSRTALFDRVGMTSAVMEMDSTGTLVGSSFTYATARDWARFGMLYLDGGVWNGERVLPEGWVEYTRTPAPADPRAAYGAHFWLKISPEFNKANAEIPRDAFHAIGTEAQFVTIVPSRRTVIVRLGRTRYPEAWDHGTFVKDVLSAISSGM